MVDKKLIYAVLALCLLNTVWQFVTSRAAGRFQRALLGSLWSMEQRSIALLSSIRRLLDEQEHQRILRDAREAQVRLAEQEHAEAIIDIGRVHDGQAAQHRRASERATLDELVGEPREMHRETGSRGGER